MPTDTPRGCTVAEVAKLYRVSEDKIRNWIKNGRLGAINTANTRCGKPRFVVLSHHLAEFERVNSVAPPPKPPRRRKRTAEIDFYPD
jgi:excisionase family DNA binding protein